MIVKSWAVAVIVLALCSGGRASGQTINFLDGFPKATNPQGRPDGKIYFAGTTQFAFGLSPTVTVSVMPKTGGLIQQYTLQLTPVMPSPPGTMTFNFGTAAAPLSTDQLPNNTYSIWAVLGLRNGTTNFSVSAGWASVVITQGAGQTGEAGSLTATGGQKGANQIVGTVAVAIPSPFDQNNNSGSVRRCGRVLRSRSRAHSTRITTPPAGQSTATCSYMGFSQGARSSRVSGCAAR